MIVHECMLSCENKECLQHIIINMIKMHCIASPSAHAMRGGDLSNGLVWTTAYQVGFESESGDCWGVGGLRKVSSDFLVFSLSPFTIMANGLNNGSDESSAS